jgi:hypothetical protein
MNRQGLGAERDNSVRLTAVVAACGDPVLLGHPYIFTSLICTIGWRSV